MLHGVLDQRREVSSAPPSYTLTVSPPDLYFDLDGIPCEVTEFTITTESGNSWNITDNRSWISCTPTSGNGTTLIDVFVVPGLEAEGTITITSSAPTEYVGVFRTAACP